MYNSLMDKLVSYKYFNVRHFSYAYYTYFTFRNTIRIIRTIALCQNLLAAYLQQVRYNLAKSSSDGMYLSHCFPHRLKAEHLYSVLCGIQTTLKRLGIDHTAFNLQRTPCQPLSRKRSPDGASTECGGGHLIAAHYSFIDPERMKGWVGLVGWPIADGLATKVVTHQLQIERRTAKERWPETDVLPLSHADQPLSLGPFTAHRI